MSVVTTQRGETFAGYNQLETMCCPTCSVLYAVPERLIAEARRLGERKRVWYCPNGHELGYNGPGEAKREDQTAEIRRARERAEWAEQRLVAERDLRKDTERRLSAQKGATTRAKKRHAAGLCPCCNRTFQQLARHMASQHPNYDPAKENA